MDETWDTWDRGPGYGWGPYPDPYHNPAAYQSARNILDRHAYHERLFMQNSLYRSGIMRAAAFLIGRIQVGVDGEGEASRDEKRKIKNFLEKTIGDVADMRGIYSALLHWHAEMRCYYNSYSTTRREFSRELKCPKCGRTVNAKEFLPVERGLRSPWRGTYLAQAAAYWGVCRCKFRGKWQIVDVESSNPRDIYIYFWNPKTITPQWDRTNGIVRGYVWRVPDRDRREIQEGVAHKINNAPPSLLEAVRDNKNLWIHPDDVFRSVVRTPSGLDMEGWGVGYPGNDYEAYQYQVLKRHNLSISQEYASPLRSFSPAARMGAATNPTQDPLVTMQGGQFQDIIREQLLRHRIDPSHVMTTPFPLDSKLHGGDANQLAPVPLIDNQAQLMLNILGVPVEMFNMTLNAQQNPQAAPLFEQANIGLLADQDAFVAHHTDRACRFLGWRSVSVELGRNSVLYDVARQQLMAQLQAAQQLPGSVVLEMLGLDWYEMMEQMVREEIFKAELSDKAKKELEERGLMTEAMGIPPVPMEVAQQMQQQQGGGQMGPAQQQAALTASAAQPGGGQQVPTTVTGMDQMAQAIAQQGMASRGNPAASRKFLEMVESRHGPEVRRQVQQYMDDMARQAEAEGGAQRKQELAQQEGAA